MVRHWGDVNGLQTPILSSYLRPMFVARILANIVIVVLTFQLRPVCESRLGIGSNKSKTKTAFGVMDDSKLPHGRAEVRFPATGHARLVYYTH